MQSQPTIIVQNQGSSSGGLLGNLIPSRFYSILALIIAVLSILLIYAAYTTFTNYVEENCPDADGLGDIAFCAVEEETDLEDTGASTGSTILSQLIWTSPLGWIGAAVGVSTEGGTVGERLSNNQTRIKNNVWTLLNRLTGR